MHHPSPPRSRAIPDGPQRGGEGLLAAGRRSHRGVGQAASGAAILWLMAVLAGCALGRTPPPPPVRWEAPIGQALAALSGQTAVPLRAPAGSVAHLGTATPPSVPLGAWVRADRSAYAVAIGLCAPGAGWRQVVASQCDGSIASIVAGFRFGGTAYSTRTAALAGLAGHAPAGPGVAVRLGGGVSARSWDGGTILTWQGSDWTFRVDTSLCPTALGASTAQRMAATIAAAARAPGLPAGPGTLVFRAACGDASSASASASWVRGADLYWDSVMGYDPATALSLARAERAYR